MPSSERAKIDSNRRAAGVVSGVTDDASLDITMLRVDPVTKRLKVDAAITVGFGSQTGVTDNEAVEVADTGVLALGTDGSNYQVLSVDASGHVQVDILSGAGGVQYTEGDTDATITGMALMWEDAANTLVVASATKPLPVDITDASIAVTGTFWQTTQPVSIAGTVAVSNAGLTELAAAINASSQMDVNIAASGVTVPVSGIFYQATQPVSIATMPSTPVTGTFYQATQPISAASLPLPTGAATEATLLTIDADTGNIVTSVQLIDDTIFTDDAAFTPATSKVSMAGFEYDDTTPDSVNEGDAGAARMSANRNIYTTIRDAAGNERGLNIDASGQLAITVASIPSHAVTNAGTFAVQESGAALTALQLIDNAISGAGFNITQLGSAAVPIGAGLEATAVRVTLPTDGTGVVKLGAGTAEIGKLAAGTAAIGKLAANNGVDIGDVDVTSIIPGVGATDLGKAIDTALGATDTGVLALAVRDDTLNIRSGTENDVEPLHTDVVGALWTDPQGNVAHDAADNGNPIKIGGKAITALSGATMVTAADRTNLYADEDGVLITKNWTTNNDILMERVSNTDGASTASTVFGATASAYNMITTIVVHNAHATTNGYVDIRDGTAGTILMTIPLPANGGAVVPLPIPLRTSANTALAFDVSAAITTVYISLIGYKSKA